MPIVYLAFYSPFTEYQTGFKRHFLSILSMFASIFLGYFLHKHIEQRFRVQHIPLNSHKIKLGVARTLVTFNLVPLILSFAMLYALQQSYFGLWREDKVPYAQDSYHRECKKISLIEILPCYFPNKSAKGSVLLIGDSHAVSMIFAFNEIVKSGGLELYYGGDFEGVDQLERLSENFQPKIVFLSRYWHLVDGEIPKKYLQKVKDLDRRYLNLVIVGQTPVFPDETLFRNQKSIFNGLYIAPKSFSRRDMDQSAFLAGEAIKEFASSNKIDFLSTVDVFCDETECVRWSNNGWLYWDDDHLSILGARSLIPALNDYLAPASS
jgi:hypothetical protein